MPGFNGTGPDGTGPMTRRGRGKSIFLFQNRKQVIFLMVTGVDTVQLCPCIIRMRRLGITGDRVLK